MSQPAIYILTNDRHTVLYTGVTGNLSDRLSGHHLKTVSSFTSRYQAHKLIYFEYHDSIYDAIVREKRIKRWRRVWKIELIESVNPSWADLRRELI